VDIHNTTNQITSIISFSTFHLAFDVAVFVLVILVCVHFGLQRGCFGLICGRFCCWDRCRDNTASRKDCPGVCPRSLMPQHVVNMSGLIHINHALVTLASVWTMHQP